MANNNGNAGGSFIIAGLQQINVREVGLVKTIQDIEKTVIMTKAGTALRVKDIALVDARSGDPAGPVWQRPFGVRMEKSSITMT